VAASGRIYDAFNFWVLMVAIIMASVLFMVLVSALECVLFFESRFANLLACCTRANDSTSSASTEVSAPVSQYSTGCWNETW